MVVWKRDLAMLLQGSSALPNQADIQCHQEQKVLDPSTIDILTSGTLCLKQKRQCVPCMAGGLHSFEASNATPL